MRSIWGLVVVVALWAAPAAAKNLCVNPSGSDSNTYAANTASGTSGSGSNCWASVYRAAHGSAPPGADVSGESAAAGDVVYVAAGTYAAAGTGNRTTPSLNPANSGSAGNFITFQCATTHACILQLSSSTGPVIGVNTRTYVKWIGFYIDEQNATPEVDTGPIVCWASTNGCWIENNRIIGYQYGHNRGDNHPGIRVEDSDNATIKGNTVSGIYTCPSGSAPCVGDTPVNGHNGAGIQLYGSTGTLIENNTISDSGSCIFLKGGPWTGSEAGSTVRYNLCYSILFSGLVAHAGTNATGANPTKIHQNIVYSSATCMRMWWFGGADDSNDPRNTHFINNTCDQNDTCLEFVGAPFTTTGLSNSVWNNICSRQTNGIQSEGTTIHQDATEVDHEHNMFYSTSGTNVVLNGGGTNVTYANWQLSPYTQDADTPALSTSDPQFTNPGTRVYTLQGGSPALTQGRVTQSIGGTNGDTIPAGAYITGSETIGAGAGAGATTIRYRFRFRVELDPPIEQRLARTAA